MVGMSELRNYPVDYINSIEDLVDSYRKEYVRVACLNAELKIEHKAAELLWWDEKGVLDERFAELEALLNEPTLADKLRKLGYTPHGKGIHIAALQEDKPDV